MRYLLVIIIFCFSILVSCNHENTGATKYSIRDSVLKEYLAEIDSVPYYDTSEINYKFLKAYQNNDTNFFKQQNLLIKKAREYNRYLNTGDTCIHLKKVEELGADESYRFTFFPAFCYMPISITVTKKGDSVNLHFLLYQNKTDTSGCKIISEYDKKLTPKEWEKFNDILQLADIWGLKRYNGVHGLDGSTIEFIGYEKGNASFNRPDKFCYVSRWGFSTLHDAFTYALKISGNKKGCYWIQ